MMDGDHPLLIDLDPAPGFPCEKSGLSKRDARYLAPELLFQGLAEPVRNGDPVTAAADVYSMGQVLDTVMRAELSRYVRAAEEYAPLRSLAEEMCAADPLERPTAQAALRALEAGLRETFQQPPGLSGFAEVAAAQRDLENQTQALDTLELADPARFTDPECGGAVAFDDDTVDSPARRVSAAENALRHANAVRAANEQVAAARRRVEGLMRRLFVSPARCPDYWAPRAQRNAGVPGAGGLSVQAVDAVQDRRLLDALTALCAPSTGPRGSNFPPLRLRLAQAWRIEHAGLWASYADERERMRAEQLAGRWPAGVLWKQRLAAPFSAAIKGLGAELDAAVGETFLLRGVLAEELPTLLAHGPRRWYHRRAFGHGVHGLTDDSRRADRDTSLDSEYGAVPELHALLYSTDVPHPGDVCYAVLCRCIMGTVLRTRDGVLNAADPHEELFPPPTVRDPKGPYREGSRDVCLRVPGTEDPYHTLVWEPRPSGIQTPLECVSFSTARVLPEFLVAYWHK
eukprot:TRINITY_DN17708_c0_g1_i1.p1 TRINITY_DN17708_c0_g1~~TRINITY_DN17708_c0_g1_i1.p1  ORF type:complete len:514 (+),score=153.46 TRINITY_DN17708_c0_g1_i1:600-2141(+)